MPGIENDLRTIQTANQIPMGSSLSTGNRVVTDSYTVDPVSGNQRKRDQQPSVQQLQRGFIVAAENGGPVDVAEIVDDASVDAAGKVSFPVYRINPSTNRLELVSDNMFKESGGLFYGKKVYVESLKKYFYYSHKTSNSTTEDDGWEPIE